MNKQTSDTSSWYLVYTKPRSEQFAQENLQRQGFSTYLPLIRTSRRHQGKYVSKIEAMFPRYLFIQLNCTTDNWSSIRSTFGVSSIVRFGEFPLQVPIALIDSLQTNDDDNGIQLVSDRELQHGDSVCIIEGVLSGLEGIYESRTSTDRVTVLLNIAGQYTRVSMTRHNIQYA